MDRGSGEFRDTLQRADAALKQSKTKDYYKILGVPRSAGEAEFKRAYRRLALEWHPDKHTQADAAQQAEAHARFTELQAAWAVLSDETTRAEYDADHKGG